MSIKPLRTSERTAARRASSFRHLLRPLVRATRKALTAPPTQPQTEPTQWKLETLEPRLLLSADLVPGVARIEGAIDQPGEQDAYEFVVTDKTKLFFDGVDGSQMVWQLQQGSTPVFNSRDLTATGDRFLELQPGTYRLAVDGLNDTLGNYTFRLIGEQAASQMQVNQPTTGRLEPGTQAALYAFNAQAGDRLYFQSGSASASPRWTLFRTLRQHRHRPAREGRQRRRRGAPQRNPRGSPGLLLDPVGHQPGAGAGGRGQVRRGGLARQSARL